MELPLLPSSLVDEPHALQLQSQAARGKGQAPSTSSHTCTNHHPHQPSFLGLRPRPHPLAVLSLFSHRCREPGRFAGTCCFLSSCGTLGKLVNLSDLGCFSVFLCFFFFFMELGVFN